jgi:hypothetical protein
MSALTFDTLKFANRLKAAGADSRLAEAEAEALSEVLELNLKEVVTKELLQQELKLLEQRMVIKLGALMVVAVGIVAVLVKLL